MNDTLMRQWQMLRLIPRHPSKISTALLIQALADEGFSISQRTIQRDLMKLSEIYPLVCDERNKPYGWSWMADADVMDIPGMDSHTALTFWLARQHLEPLLPKATIRQLEHHFKTAAHVLDLIPTDKGVPVWRDKVRVLNRGPKLKSPVVSETVQNTVYEALLLNRKVRVQYAPRSLGETKEYEINPLGLVLKDGLIYLVCSMWNYQEVRLLVLHRISGCQLTDIPVCIPGGFDLDTYIASGALDFVLGHPIRLRALFDAGAAFHLGERPLADDQGLEPQEDGRILLTATVLDSSELRW